MIIKDWIVAQIHIRIVATGMDQSRFTSIANYIELLTRKMHDDLAPLQTAPLQTAPLQTVMANAYANAPPCFIAIRDIKS